MCVSDGVCSTLISVLVCLVFMGHTSTGRLTHCEGGTECSRKRNECMLDGALDCHDDAFSLAYLLLPCFLCASSQPGRANIVKALPYGCFEVALYCCVIVCCVPECHQAHVIVSSFHSDPFCSWLILCVTQVERMGQILYVYMQAIATLINELKLVRFRVMNCA